MEFCLLDVIKYYFKNIYIVFIFILLFFIGSLIYVDKYMEYKYESNALILVGSCSYNCNILSYDDLELANELIKSYLELIKNKKVIQLVIDELKLENTYEEIKEMINVSNEKDSYFINISVITKDKNLSCLIANTLVDKLSLVTNDIYKVDNIYVINNATVSNDIVNSAIYYNLLFIIIGFLFSSLLILFSFCFDERIIIRDCNNIMGIDVLEYIKYHKKTDNLNDILKLKKKLLNDKVYLFSNIDNSDINYLLMNISISLSMDKKKVLIIDDIGLFSKKMKLENKLGLYDYFAKKMNINNIINSMDKYDIIPIGINNKKDILKINKFNRIIQLLEKEYDYIFISSKNINTIKDVLLFKLNIILVCTEYKTRVKNILKFKKNIEGSKIKVKGIVIYR